MIPIRKQMRMCTKGKKRANEIVLKKKDLTQIIMNMVGSAQIQSDLYRALWCFTGMCGT